VIDDLVYNFSVLNGIAIAQHHYAKFLVSIKPLLYSFIYKLLDESEFSEIFEVSAAILIAMWNAL